MTDDERINAILEVAKNNMDKLTPEEQKIIWGLRMTRKNNIKIAVKDN